MKTIKINLLFLVSLITITAMGSCSKDEETLMGCQTGIYNGNSQRELIRCCTQKQAMAGNNVSAGGVANFSNYTQVKWEKCDQCK